MEPGIPQLGRQSLQLVNIIRLAFHQGPVVRHQRLDEAVVGRILPRLVFAVDEEPLHVPVGHAPGVAGVVHPLGKTVDTPDTGGDFANPQLLELGGLVQENHVILRALVLIQVGILGAVAKAQRGAVGEEELPLRLDVPGNSRQLPAKGLDVVVFQLLIGAPDDEQPNSGVAQGQPLGLVPDCPAFAPAPGSAEHHMLVVILKEQNLFFAGPLNLENKVIHSSFPPRPRKPPVPGHPLRMPPGPWPSGPSEPP